MVSIYGRYLGIPGGLQGWCETSKPGDSAGIPRPFSGDSAGIPRDSGGFRGHVRGFRAVWPCLPAQSPARAAFQHMLQKHTENTHLLASGELPARPQVGVHVASSET